MTLYWDTDLPIIVKESIYSLCLGMVSVGVPFLLWFWREILWAAVKLPYNLVIVYVDYEHRKRKILTRRQRRGR